MGRKGRREMKWLDVSKAKLVLFGFVAAIALGGASAKADFIFGKPVNLETVIPVIDPAQDGIDCFSYDGLEMYIESVRPGGYGNWDLWVSRRASTDEDWGPLENLGPVLNTPAGDGTACISADGLTLYFTSNRAGSGDIYMTTRVTTHDPWAQVVNMGPKINSSADDSCPWISADGLELYFHSWRTGGDGYCDIYVARRTTQNDPWGTAVNLGHLVNSAYSEVMGSLSPDGLLFLFADAYVSKDIPRPGGQGSCDMWMARRATISGPWQAPVNLGPQVNGAEADVAPRMSPDGSILYFTTNSGGVWDNWQAAILPVVDFNGDGIVDMKDFSQLGQHWGQDEPSVVDVAPMPWGDGRVDIQDVAVLAEHWLTVF